MSRVIGKNEKKKFSTISTSLSLKKQSDFVGSISSIRSQATKAVPVTIEI